jgi:hypothetical protein
LVLRQHFRLVAIGRFLVVASLCALAIGLAGINVTGKQSVPIGSTGTTLWFPHANTFPGPDAPSNNRPAFPWDKLGR